MKRTYFAKDKNIANSGNERTFAEVKELLYVGKRV